MASHIIDLLKIVFVPIHKDGIKFILSFAIITLLLFVISASLGLVSLVLTLWCIFFFRDPDRITTKENNVVISPADGVINEISKSIQAPKELKIPKDTKWTKISIFLNVFDVHVNRIPISGKITKLIYEKGKFLSAGLKEASLKNERQIALLKTKNNNQVIFVQVAGLVARRIVCYLNEGQNVEIGNRYGIIRFGSRMDIYLPQIADIKVEVGQRMIGGETILAYLTKHKKSSKLENDKKLDNSKDIDNNDINQSIDNKDKNSSLEDKLVSDIIK